MKLSIDYCYIITGLAFLISAATATTTATINTVAKTDSSSTWASYTHALPLLEMHDVYFAALSYQLSWGSSIDKLNLVDLGGVPPSREEMHAIMEEMMKSEDREPEEELYLAFYNAISGQSQNGGPMDVVICDFFARACIDAAHSLNIPIAVLIDMCYLGFGGQSYIPFHRTTTKITLENASFWERMHDKFILPLKLKYASSPRNGLEPYREISRHFENSLAFIASVPWIDPPRPLPPIFTTLIYVAFGSVTIVTPARFEAMVQSLASAYHAGLLDGVVWGLMNTKTDEVHAVIHTNSTTKSGAVVYEEHSIEDMQHGKHPFIRILQKAPQRAVLKHPSVKLFVSHCGMGSTNEAMESATPVLGIPGFGDQPTNAAIINNLNAGRRMSWNDVGTSKMHSLLEEILSGDTNVYAADMVEMIAIPGAMKMLEPASQRMSWWKANNIDVWAALIAIIASIGASLIYASIVLFKRIVSTSIHSSNKMKKL
ncbi:hypothetical protein BDF19DRAFT_456551 [Syncephalis fuscata]|nr:hypothetical protein BDF19DRAFT_456551 [Syncephalis fuscata]